MKRYSMYLTPKGKEGSGSAEGVIRERLSQVPQGSDLGGFAWEGLCVSISWCN